MLDTKYIRYGRNNMQIFSATEEHKETAQKLDILNRARSAGFIKVYTEEGITKIECYGKSESLGLEALPEDSVIATRLLLREII